MSDPAMPQGADEPRPVDGGRGFPDCVPVLVDAAGGVALRAHTEADLPAIVEQARDPDSQHWTTVPTPPGGYSLDDARDFALNLMPAGWGAGSPLGWAIEAEIDGQRRFCGSIDLRLGGDVRHGGDGTAEVGFGLHPSARGRSVMSNALRLVRDYGFDQLGLQALHWRARVGNWGSRRVAAAAGLRFEGTVRGLLSHRGVLLDGWVATITAGDSRGRQPWMDSPELTGAAVGLRPFREADLPGIVEACSDPRTQHWLVSLPQPYAESDARGFLEATREMAAQCHGYNWCVTDITNGDLIGCISLDGFGGYSRRAEIGYWAHPRNRAKGRMTEAVEIVTAFAESGNITDSIIIRCASGNTASRHVAEAAGYAQIGVLPRSEPLRDGTLADLVLYSRP